MAVFEIERALRQPVIFLMFAAFGTFLRNYQSGYAARQSVIRFYKE